MSTNRFTTRGIVLARTNFAEADRILTFITPNHGKLRVIAKGSRKQKSKLAGGIEPFSISDLTILVGRGEVDTLMSSRLVKHFGNLTSQLDRLNTASALMRLLNKNTEDNPEPEYYKLLVRIFKALNNIDLPPNLAELWFSLQFLKLAGHSPNLRTDVLGQELDAQQKYNFDVDKMTFFAARSGKYNANHIKFLRLVIGLNKPEALMRISGWEKLVSGLGELVQSMLSSHLRI